MKYLLVLVAFTLVACEEDKPKFVPQQVVAVDEVVEEQGFVLVTKDDIFEEKMKNISTTVDRDIFRELKLISGPAVEGSGTPLEAFELAQLTLAGVVWNISLPRALVRAPNNEEFVVTLNTPIGKRGGRVVAILSDQLVIEEKFYDFRGELTEERYVLRLPTTEGEFQ